MIEIPFEPYWTCLFEEHWPLEVGFTTISLFYGTKIALAFRLAGETDAGCPIDLLAFSLIIYFALKSGSYRSKRPSMLKIMAEDATLYFLVIFTSHLLLELTLIFGSVSTSSHHSVFLLVC